MELDVMASFGVSVADVSDLCNGHAGHAHVMTRRWANYFELLGDPGRQTMFDQLGYTRLLAYGCTTAPKERLALFAQWFTYYFLLDDQQDLAVLTGRDSEFVALQDDLRQVLQGRGEGGSAPHRGLVAAVADLCRRTAPLVSDEWWHRYVSDAEKVFAAQRQENLYRLTGNVPAPHEFTDVRRRAGAADMVFDIIEACENAEIPVPVRDSSACNRYADSLNDFTTWSNDVLGIDHDAANADPNNYVLVRQHADNLDRADAISAVTAEIAVLADDLVNRKHAVADTARAYPVAQQVGIEHALTAWYDWAMNVPIHYLKANGRLSQMDRARPRQAPAFAEDLL